MKWILLAGGLTVIIIGVIAYFIFSPSMPDTAAVPTTEVTLPISGDQHGDTQTPTGTADEQETLLVANQDGGTVTVKNFTNNGETVPDTVNPGEYVLAGSLGYCLADGSCPEGAPTNAFKITYSSQWSNFNIVLVKEPLGESRTAAEQFLLSRLGVSEKQLCSLQTFVGTPVWVNASYSGQNLGFSFCPGATALPQ